MYFSGSFSSGPVEYGPLGPNRPRVMCGNSLGCGFVGMISVEVLGQEISFEALDVIGPPEQNSKSPHSHIANISPSSMGVWAGGYVTGAKLGCGLGIPNVLCASVNLAAAV